MKIVVDKDIPFIKGRLENNFQVAYRKGSEIDREVVKDADAMIVRTRTFCNEELLRGSNVKLISTATIGTDHIDIPWCESNGIRITSAPGCNAPGVAQYLFASLFFLGFEPSADTLGIVGYGNVGSTVDRWAKTMGIKTIVYDPFIESSKYDEVQFTDLRILLEESDAVTLHVPLTKLGEYPTFGMIGENELTFMKKNSIIVNSSRGGVVDEAALKKSLRIGRIRAVIDTWRNEPEIDRELLDLASITTPHIAGYSYEGKIRGTRMALQSVSDFFNFKPDLVGLYDNPTVSEDNISRHLIEKSYNPLKDSEKLKNNVKDFERFRNEYEYRHEPLFSIT